MSSALDQEIVEICEFLRTRGITFDCIERFKKEKMDSSAILNAPDEVLSQLGIKSKGDILSLRSFVKSKTGPSANRDQKKKKLLDIIRGKIKKKQTPKSGEQTQSHRKVTLGWLHFDQRQNKYVSVRMKKGGGTRSVSAKLDSSVAELIDVAGSTFFPNGGSFHGKLSSMMCDLGNFKCEPLSRENFTLQSYITNNSLTSVRLYLMTRLDEDGIEQTPLPKAPQRSTNSFSTSTCTRMNEDVLDCFEHQIPQQDAPQRPANSFLTSTHTTSTDAYNLSNNHCSSSSSACISSTATLSQPSKLIGATSNRQKLKQHQDEEYLKSLAADQKKEQHTKKVRADAKRKNQIKAARSARVLPEPGHGEPAVHISIRHLTLGVLKRKFRVTEKMCAVYDWVGSLSVEPETFTLSGCGLPEIKPFQPIEIANKVILNMAESEIIEVYPENEINFLGYGPTDDDCNDTLTESWSAFENMIPETPPHVLMVGDCDSSNDSESEDVSCGSGHTKRMKKKQTGTPTKRVDKGFHFRQVTLPNMLREQVNDTSRMRNNRPNHDSDPGDSDPGDSDPGDSDPGDSDPGDSDPGESESAGSGSGNSGSGNSSNSSGNNGALPSYSSTTSNNGENQDEEPGSNDNGRTFDSSNDQEPIKRTLRIKRSRIMHNLIEEFTDADIMSCKLTVIMLDDQGNDELGVDTGGIYRDAIGCFWQEFYTCCTIGEDQRVPVLRHDFQTREWTAVARILAKGYLDLYYFPFMISQAFVMSILFGESSVTEDILLHSFKKYVAKDEELVICEALKGNLGEDEGMDELLDLLDRFDCRKLPTRSNVKNIILELAHKELLQKAQYVADSWREVLQISWAGKQVSNITGLSDVYKHVEPTNKKVLNLLSVMANTNSERICLDYLKRYIRGLDQSQLKGFLRYVTGADVICVESITIEFSTLEGLARRPIAHTCGAVLELPSTYSSFPEMREEFTNILAKAKWQNDIM